MHSNNHARSKQKRKKLRQKNREIKVFRERCERLIDAGQPVPPSGYLEVNLNLKRMEFEALRRIGAMPRNTLNQRQKRKRRRQVGAY